MSAYRVHLEPDDNETVLITSPDIPGVVTFGETRALALAHAREAIETMIDSLIRSDEPVPEGTGGSALTPDEAAIELPLGAALKVALYRALRESGIGRGELALRLGGSERDVVHLLALDEITPVDRIERAFGAIGRAVEVSVRAAA